MDPKTCRDVESQVRYIARLMSRGEWGKHLYLELAETWQIDQNTLRKRSAEAHRLFTAFSETERQELRDSLAAKFFAIHEDALTRVNVLTGLPDYGSAIRALQMYSQHASLDTPPTAGSEKRPKRIVIERHGSEGQVQQASVPDAREPEAK